MRPVIKGLLVGCAALLVLAGIVVFVAVRFVQANKGKLQAQAAQVRAQGQEFGRSATESACVAETMSTYRNDSSILGEARARIWLSACLETSRRGSTFCAGVPSNDEIMRTVTWRLTECSRIGLDGDKGCTRILAEVQKHCETVRGRS